MSAAADIAFDPFSPDMCVDPYPHYRRLREHAPVWRSPLGFWLLTRHADLATFFTDRSLRREYEVGQTLRTGPQVGEQEYFHLFRRMLFILDNPEHQRVRRLFAAAFTPRRVNEQSPRTAAITDALLDAVHGQGRIDLVADFAAQLPKRVIGQLLGVPEDDHLLIGDWADAVGPAFEFLPMSPRVLAATNQTCKHLYDYFSTLARDRSREPRDDLMTAMVQATTENDERLTHDELISNAVLLYIAGQQTTTGGLGLALLALHRNPDQLALLTARPELMSNAVEELLRYDHPAHATIRVTTQPTRFTDVEIPSGEAVVGYVGAALRDPDAFPNPDRLDLQRDFTTRPITFGGGPYLCLGHNLARSEISHGLTALLRRYPGLRLDTLDPPYEPSPILRGPQTLPASLTS
jgi:hypothetical protein